MRFCILANEERCGEPHSPTRKHIVHTLEKADSLGGRLEMRARRSRWIKVARAEFKEWARGKREPCAVCKKYIRPRRSLFSRFPCNSSAVWTNRFTITYWHASLQEGSHPPEWRKERCVDKTGHSSSATTSVPGPKGEICRLAWSQHTLPNVCGVDEVIHPHRGDVSLFKNSFEESRSG